MYNKRKIKQSLGENFFDVFNTVFMVLFCLSILYPVWNVVTLSFATPAEAQSLGIHIWNSAWTLDPYRFILSNENIGFAYFNSIFRTVAVSILMIITSLLGAYPLSKKNLPGRNLFTTIFVIPMYFGGGMIPYFILIKQLHLMNSILVYVIPGMVGLFNILLVRNFLMSLDKALEESALLDGAGYFTILFQIIAPLSKPVLATIALWTAVGQWNSWFDSMIFITDDKKIVLQLVIQRMLKLSQQMAEDMERFRIMSRQRRFAAEIFTNNVRAAAVVITIGPIILSYPFLQKYFVKGIMIGSLKG